MSRNSYHHGDLKQELIDKGLVLLNEKGIQGFSLRKVASMCGVSHNAPYKHFSDKDALIGEIITAVWGKFSDSLKSVLEENKDNYREQMLKLGIAYVQFMVENPDYMKLMFLSDTVSPVRVVDGEFCITSKGAFTIFRDCVENYFREIGLEKTLYTSKTLEMWSMIHGLAILIAKGSIEYDGQYLELVENIIKTSI